MDDGHLPQKPVRAGGSVGRGGQAERASEVPRSLLPADSPVGFLAPELPVPCVPCQQPWRPARSPLLARLLCREALADKRLSLLACPASPAAASSRSIPIRMGPPSSCSPSLWIPGPARDMRKSFSLLLTRSCFAGDGELAQCDQLLAGKPRLMDPPERALPK